MAIKYTTNLGRVDSDVDNACYGLGPYVSLTVENCRLQILLLFLDNATTIKMEFILLIQISIDVIEWSN
jgi:hypothetical protein